MAELAQALVLLLLGGMLFFPIVVAPVVFVALPAAEAGIFLRAMFPRYYLFMIALSLAAGALYQIGHGPGYSLTASTCLGVGLSTLWVRQWLLPRINAARDAQLAGDERPAGALIETTNYRWSLILCSCWCWLLCW